MNKIELPKDFNYIAVFMTFACQLRCSYCINHHGGDLQKGRRLEPEQWIEGLNRIQSRGIPLTLQGGEPTVYKGFYDVVQGIKSETPIDLLTNLEVDVEYFMSRIPAGRMRRESPYASIRVSYHHQQSRFEDLIEKVSIMQAHGYSIGIWEVDHPEYSGDVHYRQKIAKNMGIDYRIKEFLGPWKGKNYGTFSVLHAVNDEYLRDCFCKTSELLIAPDGGIYRCHSDLYAGRTCIGNIMDASFSGEKLGQWRYCKVMGRCNSCDIKVKNNRFQQWGHSSVQIKDISDPITVNAVVEKVENTYGKTSL